MRSRPRIRSLRRWPRRAPLTGVSLILLIIAVTRVSACLGPNPEDSWTTYHLDNARDANDADGGKLRGASLRWTRDNLGAAVYAEPLIFRGAVYVVTEDDSLYVLDASTGRINWHLRLANPAIAPIIHCTAIVPLGITSTPVIDPSTSTLYAAGVVDTHRGSPRYQTWLFAIDLRARSVAFHVRIDAPGASIDGYNQRSALTLTGGRVYIPFGGRPGDCGVFHGVITSVRARDGSGLIGFQDTTGDVTGGGFWAPGGLAVERSGDLLAASGNALFRGSFCGAGFELQDTVMRLSPTLDPKPLDYWTPPDWRRMDCYDSDIGAMVPTILGDTGLIFQSGKDGKAYLLRATSSLGHGTRAPYTADLGAGECRGGAAFDGQLVFVGCQNDLFGLPLDPGKPSLRLPGRGGWRQPTGSCDAEPPILAAGAVWWLDRCDVLHASDPRTGRQMFSYHVASENHFATPAAAQGSVFVPTESGVTAFTA